jgi:hypothetical protein
MVGIKKRGIEKDCSWPLLSPLLSSLNTQFPSLSFFNYLGVAEDPQTFLKRLTKILLLILWSR